MSLLKKSISQMKNNYRLYLIVYAVLTGFLYCFAKIAEYYDISMAYFTRDPAFTLYGHPSVGVVSNLGILIWCATLAICLFCSVIHFRQADKKFAIYLLFSGLFTLLLTLDDFFVFHEYLFPYTFGIPQEAVIASYFVLMVLYLMKFGRMILEMEYTIFFLACAFFTCSLVIDMLMPQSSLQFLLEDGAKLFGIVTWFIFFSRTCYSKTLKIIER